MARAATAGWLQSRLRTYHVRERGHASQWSFSPRSSITSEKSKAATVQPSNQFLGSGGDYDRLAASKSGESVIIAHSRPEVCFEIGAL